MLKNPIIEWSSVSNQPCLKFTFRGMFSNEHAEEAVQEWKQMIESNSDNKIVLVWDCLEMSGYDTEARNLWQETLKELKHRIHTIWLITNSKLIKMGAMVVSVFTSFEIKTVSSEAEIY